MFDEKEVGSIINETHSAVEVNIKPRHGKDGLTLTMPSTAG